MRRWLDSLEPSREVTSLASPRLLAWAEEHVGQAAVAWAAEVTALVTTRLADQMVDLSGPTEIAAVRGCEECLLTTLVGLAGDGDEEVVTPGAALDDARVAARAAVPLEKLLRVVWACHAAVQEQLLDTIGATVPTDSLLPEVRRLVARLAEFIDVYVTDISTTYAQERLESESRLMVERRRMIDAVLGGAAAPEGSESVLGIRWDHHHLAALGWSAAGNRALHAEDNARGFAERVARSAGGSWLVVERGDHVEFHWAFALPTQLNLGILDAARPPRMRLAVGTVEQGVRGFARTTASARSTRAVGIAMQSPPDILRYDEVSLLGLLSADRQQARVFVRRELAGLLGADAMTSSVRDTLRLFLVAGRSRQAAASAAHVATTTVAYRVRRAEELLGRSTLERVHETIAALELAHAFPDFVAAPA